MLYDAKLRKAAAGLCDAWSSGSFEDQRIAVQEVRKCLSVTMGDSTLCATCKTDGSGCPRPDDCMGATNARRDA